ncbi:hypothetical protein [Streptomyces sp. CA-111067]|uniref:hypothetical protein n=1 Tax=Streptomyces sp. CA-111067 TaxID=3240046 RepID=UPI003D98AD3F
MIQLPEGSWWDWDVVSWDPGLLRLGAGADISYAHGLELVFSDPVFVMCPSAFQDPTFREPTPDEVRLVARQIGEPPAVLVAFDADAGAPAPAAALIAAAHVDIVQGLVFRYWRTPLKPSERLAPWVHPPVEAGRLPARMHEKGPRPAQTQGGGPLRGVAARGFEPR